MSIIKKKQKSHALLLKNKGLICKKGDGILKQHSYPKINMLRSTSYIVSILIHLVALSLVYSFDGAT